MIVLPRRTLPVLMYHRFGSSPDGDPALWISPEQFRRQLDWLSANGYRTLTLDEAYTALTANRPPSRAVLLTIDDGFEEDLRTAGAILRQTGSRAAVFVPAGLVGQPVELRHPSGDTDLVSRGTLADAADLVRWIDQGFDIGSHSLTHLDLTTVPPPTLSSEIRGSKKSLEELLGRPVRDFCYPFAHHDERSRAEAAAAGYRAAYAGEPPFDSLFAVPRMMVYPRDDLARFRRKVSGYYFWISRWHQKLRRIVRN